MIKILNKYDILRICDKCGNEKILQKVSGLSALMKKEKHFCMSCSRSGHQYYGGSHSLFDKSIYIPVKHKSHKFVKMISKY